jgi:DNA-directed RNA polymerase specialized sigma24 family protein
MDEINQAIFWSAAVEGEAAQEVGDRMGLSVLAVKARLFRIRTALRQTAGELTGLQGSGMAMLQAA